MAENNSPEVQAEIRPCKHMEQWVSALSDGSLTGLARWYTQMHVSGCHKCQAALEALHRLQERLHALRDSENAPAPQTLPLNRREALEAALDEIEKKRR